MFGVNPGKHRKFAAQIEIPYPLLSDPGGKTAKAYGARGLLMNKRTVVGIDAKGVIRFHRRGAPLASQILDSMRDPSA